MGFGFIVVVTILTIKIPLFTETEWSVIKSNDVVANLMLPVELWICLYILYIHLLVILNHISVYKINRTFFTSTCSFCGLFSSWTLFFLGSDTLRLLWVPNVDSVPLMKLNDFIKLISVYYTIKIQSCNGKTLGPLWRLHPCQEAAGLLNHSTVNTR